MFPAVGQKSWWFFFTHGTPRIISPRMSKPNAKDRAVHQICNESTREIKEHEQWTKKKLFVLRVMRFVMKERRKRTLEGPKLFCDLISVIVIIIIHCLTQI